MKAGNGVLAESGGVAVAGKLRGKTSKQETAESVVIPAIETKVAKIMVVGMTDLYIHQFGAKAQRIMAEKQEGKATLRKAPKVPFDEFLSCLYIINEERVPKTKLSVGESWPYVKDTFGIKASAFKNAMVSACSFLGKSVTKVSVRGAIHVLGNILPLIYDKVEMAQDPVINGGFGGTADLRYRPLFKGWKVELTVRFNSRIFTLEQIANLLENAGFHVGVGDWRPECDGTSGTFAVERR